MRDLIRTLTASKDHVPGKVDFHRSIVDPWDFEVKRRLNEPAISKNPLKLLSQASVAFDALLTLRTHKQPSKQTISGHQTFLYAKENSACLRIEESFDEQT